jgi:hypothetical protein
MLEEDCEGVGLRWGYEANNRAEAWFRDIKQLSKPRLVPLVNVF